MAEDAIKVTPKAAAPVSDEDQYMLDRGWAKNKAGKWAKDVLNGEGKVVGVKVRN